MKVVNDSERQWWKCSVSSVRRVVILVEKDRAVAGIVLYLAQDSPGLTIPGRSADWGPGLMLGLSASSSLWRCRI